MSDDEIRRAIAKALDDAVYHDTGTAGERWPASEDDQIMTDLVELVRTAVARATAPVGAAGALSVHTGPWEIGDVARDADNDHVEDCWVHLPEFVGDSEPWRPLALLDDDEWFSRDQLPANLALIVRGGMPVTH